MSQKAIWIRKAKELNPVLHCERVRPAGGMPGEAIDEGTCAILDFGNHFVGRLTLRFGFLGSHPDAPAWVRVKFCESSRELDENHDGYTGWISKGWIQEDQIHLDVLPCELSLPRRYAFRYVKIESLAVSRRYRLTLQDAWADTTTSADETDFPAFEGTPEDMAIDRVALRTLRSCMQEVFEDGPKRDRRLWMGDLRLQALANYATFRNNALVRRCLYLFAGTADDRGWVSACLFLQPEIQADDNYMFDYSLLYVSTLLDYVKHTGDTDTGAELLPVALRQLELAEEQFDQKTGIIKDSDRLGWCFVDWNLNLNKQASAQAIWVYCAKAACSLMKLLNRNDEQNRLGNLIAFRSKAALAHLFDSSAGLIVSGKERQVSWASQVWFVLADILPVETAISCLRAVAGCGEAVGMVTPYMMHHYADALFSLGQDKQALQVIRDYWGGMVSLGADTFFELFNPGNPDESPYGSPVVNSYCHAWSCTPSYFLRRKN